MRWPIAGALFGLFTSAVNLKGEDQAQPLDLALPTENDALFRGEGEQFYQFIERDFKGAKSRPWQGGRYGFVRNPVETSLGVIYSRFHEGIDIRPLRRDTRGEPLDEIRAIAAGTVVHVNLVSGFSSYGRYIVVRHRWSGSDYYSLYGHLNSIAVKPGDEIRRGELLGVMGYTGEGLHQERAHLHLELNLILSHQFEAWHRFAFKNDPNRHGIYNGINLAGIDIARFYLELRKRPSLTIPQFLSAEEVFYRITLPRSEHFDLARFYPWMVDKSGDEKVESWEVSFNRAGVPLKIQAVSEAVREPTLSYTRKNRIDYSYLTRGALGGRGERSTLTENGKRLARLLIYPD